MASASFVVTVGDNFYENGVNGVDDPLWRTVWRNVYLALPALRVPWYVGVGNHDYRGDCFAEEQYSALEPLWRMPAKHFTHTHSLPGGAGLFTEFVHFDTVPFVPDYYNKSSMQRCMQFADVDAEKQWLTSAVAAARANTSVAWRFAVGHHPAFSVGHHGDTPSLQTFLHPLIRDAGFAAYFAGHEHDLQHLAVEGVQHFVSGGGSEYRDDPNTDEPTWSRASGGFLHASVNESHAKFQFISHTGAPLLTLLQARVP
jgi:tartrate-resistant acid phosphatase type 5